MFSDAQGWGDSTRRSDRIWLKHVQPLHARRAGGDPQPLCRACRDVNAGRPIVHPREPGWVVRSVDGTPVLEQMTWGFPVQLRR